MNKAQKPVLLQRLLDHKPRANISDSDHPDFKSWKSMVERTLHKVFGAQSQELRQFTKLRFYFNPGIWIGGEDYSADHYRCYIRDMEIAEKLLQSFLEEVEFDQDTEEVGITDDPQGLKKIFISHSSKDASLVEELIEMLELIGLSSSQIFCTSFEGYGIELGENFLDAIRSELDQQTLVVFLISKSFYESPVCLCEMGACWVQSMDHIPIIVPPLTFADIRGVIPLTQGMEVTDSQKYNLLRQKICDQLPVDNPADELTWERKRDRIVNRIRKWIGQDQ